MLGRYQAIAKRLRDVAATILALSLVAPAVAQSTFPDFDFKSECEMYGRWVVTGEDGRYLNKTVATNGCLDKEASARESAEYKWGMASEDVRAKAMAQLDAHLAGASVKPYYYEYLDTYLSAYSEQEAAKRLHEKRPGVNY
jgi:hypothetical protein